MWALIKFPNPGSFWSRFFPKSPFWSNFFEKFEGPERDSNPPWEIHNLLC